MQPESLLVPQERAQELKREALHLTSWDLTLRQQCDLELLLNGGFSPLKGFMNSKDYADVVKDMRLANGTIWPIPIILDVPLTFAERITTGQRIVLRDQEGVALAVLTVSDKWKADKVEEAKFVYGTTDELHSGVAALFQETSDIYIGGNVEGIELPSHHSFTSLRYTPQELHRIFAEHGWTKIVGFQTRNPMHKVHYEIAKRAAQQSGAALLLHPSVGMTKPGDVDYYTRVRCYQALLPHYNQQTTMLSLLPLAMRMAGPREAIWHAIIRKNYGCTHFVVGRDHAGPGSDANGKPFYDPYDAQKMALKYANEIGITILPFEDLLYIEETAEYVPASNVSPQTKTLSISGTELRRRLKTGLPIPEWFSFPNVITELRKAYPERPRQGITIFFTGLSGAGKSTIAKSLYEKLMEVGGRPVTLLDGDVVRKHLSSELGFSKEHRDINIRRIGYVASEITKNRGIAICAPIAPYDATRKAVRGLISAYGAFILVHVSTPLSICEERDRKGLYAKARAGLVKEFTGISDPYEIPADAELSIDTSNITPEQAAQRVFTYLATEGYF